jgi:hypothetical protein
MKLRTTTMAERLGMRRNVERAHEDAIRRLVFRHVDLAIAVARLYVHDGRLADADDILRNTFERGRND